MIEVHKFDKLLSKTEERYVKMIAIIKWKTQTEAFFLDRNCYSKHFNIATSLGQNIATCPHLGVG